MEIHIKLDHNEPVKIYGEQHPLPDWDPEALRAEIQDLKLENDRLKQREEKMMHVIKSIACDYGDCEKCLFFGSDRLPCGDAGDDYKVCVSLLNELEDL